MKNLPLLTTALLAGAFTLFATQLSRAQSITLDPETTNSDITNGGYFLSQTEPTSDPTPGSGTDIFSYAQSPYVTSVAPDFGAFGYPVYGTIAVGTTDYYTGLYYTSNGTAAFQPVATINLSDTNPGTAISAFGVGILTGVSGGDPESNDLYELTLYSSDNMALATTQLNTVSDAPSGESDDFLNATISGAVTGDYIVVSAARNPAQDGDGNYTYGANIVFNGVTFSATTPEPSTYALMLAGLGALVLVARLRRSNS